MNQYTSTCGHSVTFHYVKEYFDIDSAFLEQCRYTEHCEWRQVVLFFLLSTTPWKAYWGSGGITPCIPNFITRWRWVVSFAPRPLYPPPQGKSLRCPLDRRPG